MTPIRNIPNLSIYNIHRDATNLKSISNGKVTFIDFWFIPCAPCFAEMNMLHKLYEKYRANSNVCFITITLTDSSFVRPLIENRNTTSNQTYSYFRSMSQLDSFKLPVYFLKTFTSKQRTFVKSNRGYTGQGEGPLKTNPASPAKLFGFPGYPTILIFDKQGKLVYNKTGYNRSNETVQQQTIEEHINHAL